MKLAYALLASVASAVDVCTNCTAECNNDQSVTITIPYHRTAEILSLTYGDCNVTSAGVRGADAQLSDNSFSISLDMASCNMDSKLRSLDYDASVTDIVVGVNSQTMQLEFSRFQFDTFCSYDDTYVVEFNYGNLTTDEQLFNETGGEIGYVFSIDACAAQDCDPNAFLTQLSTNKGGEMIYLALRTTSSHFDQSTKKYAPTDCKVEETTTSGLEYTLFTTADSAGCTNTDIGFAISYDAASNQWEFEHVLFLLGSQETSSFKLVCNVVVCDYDKVSSLCNTAATSCGTSY